MSAMSAAGPRTSIASTTPSVAADTLTDGVNNPGWMKLSNATPGTPGFGSYNYCSEQCSYDMPVASPPGRPDVVWIGGQMQYDEIFTATPPSNGRAVQRSADAGVSFTDMTNDTQSPPLGMHPDQHAIAFSPTNPDIAFLGSDGGVVRTSGRFADASADCDGRGILGRGSDRLQGVAQRRSRRRSRSLNDGLADAAVPERVARRESIRGGTCSAARRTTARGRSAASPGPGSNRSAATAVNRDRRRQRQHPDAHLLRAAGRREFPRQRSARLELVGRRAECAAAKPPRFYAPLINDPKVAGTLVHRAAARLAHEGQRRRSQAFLELHCNEFFGDFTVECGDWEPLGRRVPAI